MYFLSLYFSSWLRFFHHFQLSSEIKNSINCTKNKVTYKTLDIKRRSSFLLMLLILTLSNLMFLAFFTRKPSKHTGRSATNLINCAFSVTCLFPVILGATLPNLLNCYVFFSWWLFLSLQERYHNKKNNLLTKHGFRSLQCTQWVVSLLTFYFLAQRPTVL